MFESFSYSNVFIRYERLFTSAQKRHLFSVLRLQYSLNYHDFLFHLPIRYIGIYMRSMCYHVNCLVQGEVSEKMEVLSCTCGRK